MSLYTTRSSGDSLTLSLAEERDEMHRSYQSILPCQNKLLQKRWDKTYYDEHRRKVANVAPMVDTGAPQTFMHLHLKLKKLQIEEDRLDIIERDNRILLEKMAYIMRTKGRVDNYHGYRNKSLNAERREREHLRISVENKNIMRRILSRQPVYSHRTWMNDWDKNRVLQSNISHFPNKWWKTTKSNKRTPRDSTMRKDRKAGGGTVRNRKDDDEYSQDYESEDDEGDTPTAVNTAQRSQRSPEVTRREEKPKPKEGKKEEGEEKEDKNEGHERVTTEKEGEKKEGKETTENNETEQEQEKMAKESPEIPDDSEIGAGQS